MVGLIAFGMAATAQVPAGTVALETRYVQWVLSAEGRTLRFVDRTSGRDYAAKPGEVPFATARVGDAHVACSVLRQEGERLVLVFRMPGDSDDLSVRLQVQRRRDILVLSVEQAPEAIEELRYGSAELALKGDRSEPFAACSLARNLRTNVWTLPGPSSSLHAFAYGRLGLNGSSVAVVAGPMRAFRRLLQQAVETAPELPRSPIGGPWALDAKPNRRSYLFNFGGLNATTCGPWIELAHALGAGQIDFHGGVSFRFGDFVPDPKTYPNGIADLKATVDALHAAGLQAGLHTYSFFLAKNSRYVTPVPDRRLAALRTFTLAEPLDSTSTTITVNEPTSGVHATTGFFVNNSATLRIGDELVTFTEASQGPPWRFTGCTRGALGTHASSHAAGERADHLKELFGLFAPDPESDLFTEIVENTARTYNECGFDMIYLDALDGSYILAGPEWAWYYGARFVYELVRRLRKPAIMEMSTFHHHLWCVRARMGAWDAPHTGYKEFVDMHRVVNRDCQRMYLPSHLGWWGVFPWNGIQPDRTLSDDLEYLLCKALADDAGVSFVAGFAPETFGRSAGAQRYAEMVRRYERLRASGAVPAALRRRLGQPGLEFTLVDGPKGRRAFVPVRYEKRFGQGTASEYRVPNPFSTQPLSLRIEPLLAPAHDAPSLPPLLGSHDAGSLSAPRCAEGVRLSVSSAIVPKDDDGPAGRPDSACLRLVASSTRSARRGAWAMVERVFAAPMDMTRKGMGVWIHGDGKGAVLNFQLRNAENVSPGVAEHYVVVDFKGWRYVEMVEPESDRLSAYSWPYAAHRSEWEHNPGLAFTSAYKTYHPWLNYQVVAALAIWVNEIPAGDSTEILIGDVVPLSLTASKISDPKVTVAGRTVTFRVELNSGQYLELEPSGEAMVYGAENEPIGRVTTVASDLTSRAELPPSHSTGSGASRSGSARAQLPSGASEVRFACGAGDGPVPRYRITFIMRGAPLRF